MAQSVFRRTSTVSVVRVKLDPEVDRAALEPAVGRRCAPERHADSGAGVLRRAVGVARSADRRVRLSDRRHHGAGVRVRRAGHHVHRGQPALGRNRDPPRARLPRRSGRHVRPGRGDGARAGRGNPGRGHGVRGAGRATPRRRSTRRSNWPSRSGSPRRRYAPASGGTSRLASSAAWRRRCAPSACPSPPFCGDPERSRRILRQLEPGHHQWQRHSTSCGSTDRGAGGPGSFESSGRWRPSPS